jgi:hypothetical protein
VAAGWAQWSVVRVPLEDSGTPAVAVVQGIDDATLLGTVARTVKQLGMPLSSPVYAYFYATAEAFELGLVTEARAERWFAKDQASFAVGVGTRYGIFLRADKLAGMSLANRVGVVAHELTHVSQFELAGGGRGAAEQWLREGVADWIRYRVIETLGLGAYAESRQRVINGLRRSSRPFPGLRALSTNRQWTTAAMQYGSGGTYGPAFLATDWLVERFGREAVVTYFRRAGVLLDGDQAFREAFGLTLARFSEEFGVHLSALGSR